MGTRKMGRAYHEAGHLVVIDHLFSVTGESELVLQKWRTCLDGGDAFHANEELKRYRKERTRSLAPPPEGWQNRGRWDESLEDWRARQRK